QILRLPAVQRQVQDLLLIDELANRSALGSHQLGVSRNRNLLRNIANFQLNRHIGSLIERQGDAALDVSCKAGFFDGKLILANRQSREGNYAVGARLSLP